MSPDFMASNRVKIRQFFLLETEFCCDKDFIELNESGKRKKNERT